ncbi:uncharacterized protein LOC110715631 [Chenopodium quinoa]|uniref:uncharacterized protein LOC110715631 n=1 Tax=Chenopodium quinoa TaxID=63459 RepID=UPI000B79358B|nr:uncharacterized protein LOC110715631 [Chenopodium quinoa]
MVWSLGGPPKLHHFVWRACKGSLGTLDVLYRRQIRNSSVCTICGAERETIIHYLFYCKHALNIWNYSEFGALIAEAPHESFADLFCWLVSKVEKPQLRVIMCLAWASWHCRNKVIFDGDNDVNGVQVAMGFVKLCEDYDVYNVKVGGRVCVAGSAAPSNTAWKPPEQQFVKVNVDAYVPGNAGVSLGVVIRDENGALLCVAVQKTGCRWQSDYAEAAAARYGVEVASRLGYAYVVLECDALNVVRAVAENQQGAAPIFTFDEDIRRISVVFSSFKCCHVRCVGNTVAHLVARWESEINSERVCMNCSPKVFNLWRNLI